MAASSDATRTVKRRGILAAAGAIVAGIAAKQAAHPVAAVDVFTIPGNYTGTIFGASVWTISNVSLGNNASAIAGLATSSSQSAGVLGYNQNGTGISGATESNSLPANGLYGLYGKADTGTGAKATANTGIGVHGFSTSGIGVRGESSFGTGVYGATNATNQYGMLGTTYAPNSTAIAGTCTGNGSSAFSGGTTNANAFAAFFQGTTVVQGNFAVTGTKSAVIQHPRTGDHRLVYCVESPEAWFEDFGKGQLTGGKATVTFDPDFAALIHTDDYHVFLTEYGESNGLYVSAQSASGFVVQERNKGTSGGRFSWRVVAKRADVKGERLGKFVMPNLPLPDPAKFKAPETPTAATSKKP